MKIDPQNIQVVRNPDKNRFEIAVGDQLAVTEYLQTGTRITFTHTEVPVGLEGNGIGSKLAKTALEFAREQRLTVLPLCPYIAAYIKRHPEYLSIVLPGFRIP